MWLFFFIAQIEYRKMFVNRPYTNRHIIKKLHHADDDQRKWLLKFTVVIFGFV